MWLIVCDPTDISALWAGKELRTRGLFPVEFVSPMQLACAHHLEYRAEKGESTYAFAELSDGRHIDTRRLSGTLNRATRVNYPQLQHAVPADRTYVHAEMDAIFLAWLGALTAPVFNPAQPSGWAGPIFHPFVWALLAQQAGFETMAYRCGYSGLELPHSQNHHMTSHLIFGDRIFPCLPNELEHAAHRLSDSTGIPLLGITLAWMPDGRVNFIEATPTPDLRLGGTEFLDALTIALTAT